jgi:predicted NUDIX family NTP pyrophosphohydrolase
MEVFLIHPGGPFWSRKDAGAWSIPKGLLNPGEDALSGAWREFHEETGYAAHSPGAEMDLGRFRLPGGKQLLIWAAEGDCDPERLVSERFEMEWPPRSGQRQQFPEADRGAWFDQPQALEKITKGQRQVIEKFYAERDREALDA